MPTSRPTLSVVVPIHNAERYLGPCLASLADQTLTDLEVIMVDDGSADNGAVIAKALAARDERFQLIERANQGPGPARNEGVRHATGRYLAFADADDLVPPTGYERLVRSLEKTGSDLATGNVMNIGEGTLLPRWSRLHAGVFARRARTHIREHPLLVRDRAPSNKVFRREFWDRHRLEFPAGLYEDRPVMMRAHLLADAVDVRSETVYYWRRHSAAVDENRFDLANLEQRLMSAGRVRAVLAELAPRLLPGYDQHMLLGVELPVLLGMLRGIPEAERSRFVALGAALIKGADPEPVTALPAIDRLKWYLLGERREPELLEVLRFRSLRGPGKTGTLRQAGRWYAPYPYFRDPERAIPDHLYDVTAEVTPVARIDRAEWAAERPGTLRLEGHAFLRHLDASSRQDTRLRLWLVPTNRFGRWARLVRVALPVRQVSRPDVTAGSRQSAVSHEWSGFVADIEVDRLRLLRRWRAVDWKVVVEITTRGVTRSCTLDEPPPGCRLWAAHHDVSDGVRVQPVLVDKHFMLQVRPVGALVTGHRVIAGELEIEGWTSEDPGTKSSVAFRHARRKVRVAAQITTRPDGRFGFRARLPLADLTAAPADRLSGVTEAVTRLGDGLDWDLTVPGGQRAMLSSAAGEARYPVAEGTAEFALTRTRHGVLCGVERSPRPTVTSVRWADSGALMLSGEYAGGDRPGQLILRHARSGEEHRSALSWEGDRFAATLTPAAVLFFGVPGPLSAGAWDLYAVTETAGEVAVVIERGAIRDLPGPRITGCVEVTPRVRRIDALQLYVRAALAEDERGPYAQARLATGHYQARRTEPLLDLVVFDAYKGKQFACNPRGVFEEMRRRDLPLDLVWVSENGRFAVPDGVRTVQAGSRRHYEALARARYVVGNSAQQPWFEKREGQTYLQCWHGTPLKRIGFDVLEMPRRRLEGLRWMEYDVARWDLLLSQNAFSTPLLRRAFRYEGEVLESGYPRNDLLVGPGRERMAADVRRRLGIPPDRKVVLYAPTWRDELHVAIDKRAFKLELDLARAREALGRDHVLLLRTHYLVTDRSPVRGDDFVWDVSRYPDITELYLISDVLVTDYSSAMFDFAVTGRPMLFFTYDLERYRDDVRGFYFDLEAEAPGPLLRTSEAVLDAVRHLDDAAAEEYRDRYAAFTARFCPFDDGNAGRRVVDRLLR